MIFFQILWAFYLDDILILYGYDYSLSNLLIKDFFFFLEKKLFAILQFLLLLGSVCCLPWFLLDTGLSLLCFHLYQSSLWVDVGTSQYCGIGELLRVWVRTRFGGSHSYISSLVPVKLLLDFREWPHYFHFVCRVNKICSSSRAQEVGMGWVPNIAVASFRSPYHVCPMSLAFSSFWTVLGSSEWSHLALLSVCQALSSECELLSILGSILPSRHLSKAFRLWPVSIRCGSIWVPCIQCYSYREGTKINSRNTFP